MRLAKLKLKNIASLKGEHEIDFLDIQAHSPLFAITGETGSGKSSILNAIGLALYGQIYKKNVNQIDIVTLGEKDGSIELIFQVKGKYYLADWRARVLKQNGEPYATAQTPSRNLYATEAPRFDAPKNISPISTNELLNLDFDQFTKCIILNQGEFARFLSSSFTERKEILEKLYPGELLESMGRELKQQLDTLLKTKEGLEIELQTLRGDGISGDVLKEQKKTLETKKNQFQNLFKKIETLDYHFTGLYSNHEKYFENERRKSSIKKDMSDQTTKYNLLIKKGQEISERKDQTQKELEIRLPKLQLLLKEEESLKHLINNRDQLRRRKEVIISDIEKRVITLANISSEKEKAYLKLESTTKDITLPIDQLRHARAFLDELFDLYSQKELICEELKGKNERLGSIENQGKELKKNLAEKSEKLTHSLDELKNLETELETKKKAATVSIEKNQRAQIKRNDLYKTNLERENEINSYKSRLKALAALTLDSQEEISPIETTLTLQELLSASEVCISHALASNDSSCPVCHQSVTHSRWQELKNKVAQTDIEGLKIKFKQLNLVIVQSQEEEKIINTNLASLEGAKQRQLKEIEELDHLLQTKIPSIEEIDKELSIVKKNIWESESILKEKIKIESDLVKIRENYSSLKEEIKIISQKSDNIDKRIELLHPKIKGLVPELNSSSIFLLKKEARLLAVTIEAEGLLLKVTQDLQHQEERQNQQNTEISKIEAEEEVIHEKIILLEEKLKQELGEITAAHEIEALNARLKAAREAWAIEEREQKSQELLLKEFQSRLYELDKLTHDYELQFTKERHTIREEANAFEITSRVETNKLFDYLKNLALNLIDSVDLFIPLKDLLKSEKEFHKEALNTTVMELATVNARFEDWEKLQDKILLAQLKNKDISEKFERRERLYEVLGKDELRTFVLSLVEENLIQQTNQELQRLCQGRYEILHQSRRMRMTPEFFILDKFREGGLRKISTLSGGETFMVSLAMALALAEMTRGQAEIDSLFIDEGFGTLDQESLEDVLDMLNQIQNRGLMVGIISHIKTLTSALPVNLVLNKKQDGTSNISIRIN